MRKRVTNKRNGIIFIIQGLIFLWMVVHSISKPCNIEIYPEDFNLNEPWITQDERKIESTMLASDNMVVYRESELPQDQTKALTIQELGEGDNYERCIAESDAFSVKPGMYQIEVQYYSIRNHNEAAASAEDFTGNISLSTENNASRIFYNPIILQDGICKNSTRLWVRSIKSLDDIKVYVNYSGTGDLSIYHVSIREITIWRVVKCILVLLLFACVDLLYSFCIKKGNQQKQMITLSLLGILLFVSLPLFTNFLFTGHDLDFHIARIYALACEIQHGNWAAPIQTEMVNGYGYATPLFYSQLYLYFPALLYLLGFPIQECYKIYVFAMNALTVFGSYYCFLQISKDKKISVLTTFLYAASAYRVTNIYTRGAVGEYTAMVFFPFIICGFYHLYTEEKASVKHYLEVAAGLAGLLYCHVLSCEMVLIFLVIFLIWQWKKTFSREIFVRLVKAALLTLLCSLAFVIPFLDSYRMELHVKKVNISTIQHHGAYLLQVFSPFFDSQGKSYAGMQSDMPLSVGLALGIAIFLYLWSYVGKKGQSCGKQMQILEKICFVFSLLSIGLTLRAFPWDCMEEISPIAAKFFWMVQFPWRYLVLATVFLSFLMLCVLCRLKKEKTINICILMALLAFINTLSTGWYYMDYAEKNEYKYVYGGADVLADISAGEYILEGTVQGNLLWRNILADFSQVAVTKFDAQHGKIELDCINISREEQLVQLPVSNYANYHAYIDGKEIEIKNGMDNRLSVMIPAEFQGNVSICYKIPLLWYLAYFISAISFILITGWAIINGMKDKRFYGNTENDMLNQEEEIDE